MTRRSKPHPTRTPPVARWLLHHCTPPAKRPFVLGDLDEAFATRVSRDPARARSWYRRQAVLSALIMLRTRLHRRPTRRHGMSIGNIVYDLRHAARGLRLNPLFTLAAIGTLVVGIGGTVALFSVVRAVLLTPPAYEAPEQVVHLYETRANRGRAMGGSALLQGRHNMAYPDVIDVRDRTETLSGVAARQSWTPTLLGAGDPVRLRGGSVSAPYFTILGIPAVEGRVFDEGDGVPGHPPVVVLSHRLWVERFGSDPAVIGRSLDLSGTAYEVVGVIPPDFEDTEGPLDVWRADPPHFDVGLLSRTGHSYRPVARIAPGYTLDDVNAELRQINANLITEYPEKTGDGMAAVPIMDVLVGESRPAIVLLFTAVSLLLLIACANVANLLLGRSAARRREMAVRTAIGASPRRLTGQLFAESLLLAGVGGVAGVMLAGALVPLFVGMGTAIPRADRITVDPVVVGFAVLVTAVGGVAFGLAPVWLARRQAPAANLRDGQRTVEAGGGLTLRNTLVVSELALSIVLLIGAGLLIRSFVNLQRVDPGIRTAQVLTMEVNPSAANWPAHSDLTRYWNQVIERVNAVPGVRRASAVSFLPLSGGYEGQGIRRADLPPPEPGQGSGAEARAVTLDYFQTLGIPLLHGRGFTSADDSASTAVSVINQTLAEQMFSGEEPLGKQIVVQGIPREIVGVVGDVHQFGVQSAARPEIYAPHAQPFVSWIRRTMDLVVHTEVDPLSVAAPVRRAVWSIDATAPIANVKTIEQWAAEDVSGPRFRTVLLGVFAAAALLLAIVGITGVLSYAVGRRTQEFGLRAALGATASDVVRMVLLQGGRLIAIGVALGVTGSLLGARLLRSVLYGVEPTDPITLALVTAGVVAIATAAMLVPALRAGRVSPLVAMRAD